jgi:hypothetical protein
VQLEQYLERCIEVPLVIERVNPMQERLKSELRTISHPHGIPFSVITTTELLTLSLQGHSVMHDTLDLACITPLNTGTMTEIYSMFVRDV